MVSLGREEGGGGGRRCRLTMKQRSAKPKSVRPRRLQKEPFRSLLLLLLPPVKIFFYNTAAAAAAALFLEETPHTTLENDEGVHHHMIKSLFQWPDSNIAFFFYFPSQKFWETDLCLYGCVCKWYLLCVLPTTTTTCYILLTLQWEATLCNCRCATGPRPRHRCCCASHRF